MTLERDVQDAIIGAWGSHPRVRFWRQNVGAAKLGGRVVRFGLPGTSDLLGLIAPTGRLLAIEVKGPKGRQTDEQKTFERIVTAMGGLYVLVKSLADLEAALATAGVTR